MPRHPRRLGNRRRPQSRSRGDSKVTADLDQLAVYQRQQLRYGAPAVLDIVYPSLKQKTYTFSINYNAGAITLGTVNLAQSYNFQLSALPLSSSFTNMFDRYRVLMWQLQFNPVNMPTAMYTAPIVTAIDYDDASTPSAEIQQRDTALTVPIGQYFERTLQPRLAVAAYSGAFTSYANMPSNTWIDSGSPSVQFYGIKIFSYQTTATNTNIYNVSARVLLQFKNNF